MMGERDPQKQLWSYQVNLDKRVRSDHLLRRINQALDQRYESQTLPARGLSPPNASHRILFTRIGISQVYPSVFIQRVTPFSEGGAYFWSTI